MANKYPLVLDGTSIQELQSGDILIGDGALPSQTGEAGKYLTTNGTSPSWATVNTSAAGSDTQLQYNNAGARAGAAGLVTDGSNLTIRNQGDLRLADSDSSNWVALQAPATVASNITWTLPAVDGANGQVLSTNGSGTLSWSAGAAPGPFADGSAGSPSITFANDTNTGIYRIANDTLGFATNGTNRAQIDNNGKFYVGSTTGKGNLNVNDSFWVGSTETNGHMLAKHGGIAIYVSPSGNDTTGNGSTGNPYATISRAQQDIPRVLANNQNFVIYLLAGTHTLTSSIYLEGHIGRGKIYIRGATTASTTLNLNGHFIDATECTEIHVQELTINQFVGSWIFRFERCGYTRIYNTVTMNKDGSPGWNYTIGYYNCPNNLLQGTINGLSTYQGGLGGVVIVAGSGTHLYFDGSITKAGSRVGACAFSITQDAWLETAGTINNWSTGIEFHHHYGNNISGNLLCSGGTISNCNIGILAEYAAAIGFFVTPTFSGNTTNIHYGTHIRSNDDYSGVQRLLVGYTSNNNSAYRLQVNSQIFATSSTVATSDGRYKQNVVPLSNALDIVNDLNPVQFKWIPNDFHNFDTENVQVGFIAQEVMETLANKPYLNSIIKTNKRELVSADIETIIIKEGTPPVYDERGVIITPGVPPVTEERIIKPAEVEEFYGIAESNMIAILTKALQEVSAKCDSLEARLAALENN
jgi:hypothetical protein